ncbi:16S rRNA (guanine(966)-N(2))-methyltransferase RsmD [Rhodococcus aerolatus]
MAGSARGRRLAVPAGGTRPTADRVREAVFSALAARTDLEGARVLDLYAGSAALGLEALSRGAAQLVAVEADARSAAVARANVAAVGLPGAAVRTSRVASLLAGGTDAAFDLVLADPPYAVTEAAVTGVLTALLTHGWLAEGSLVVLERSSRGPATTWPEGLDPLWERVYGEARCEIATCYRPAP